VDADVHAAKGDFERNRREYPPQFRQTQATGTATTAKYPVVADGKDVSGGCG
jgi:hypothetical protein